MSAAGEGRAAAERAAGAERRVSGSVEETERLGEAMAGALLPGDVIVLSGPLGAGKTRFVAGLARGLKAKARVRSPSFAILIPYRGERLLLHLDLYRIEPHEVEGLGLEEQLERGVLVVEWGEKLPAALRREALALRFEILSETERAIAARAAGGRGLELLQRWRALGPRGARSA